MIVATNNYSIDYLKRAAFNDEIQNVLSVMEIEYQDENICAVIEYLKQRIIDIDKIYKKK
jgi:hypothetical protein